jgi:hypothetical protein
MSLWGNLDIKSGSGTGTVTVTAANSTVIGASGADLTDFAAGDILNVGQNNYVFTSIANATVAFVATVNGQTMVGAQANGDYVVSEKPLFVGFAEATNAGGDLDVIYGVDTNEIQAEADQGTPVAHTGWVRRTTGTGGRAGRTFTEVLVAGGISGDAEDVVMQDLNINITTQPADDESATGATDVTFSVVASTVPAGGSLTYAWYRSTDSGANYTAVDGVIDSGVYSDFTTDTLAISDNTGLDGYMYRVVVGATGATSVTSDAATLTETP